MANKFDYSGVRPYIEQPLITSEEATTLNLASDLKEYIYIQSSESNLQKHSIYKYDTGSYDSVHGNILSDFIAWQIAHPEFFKLYKMTKHQAAMMEFKPKLIAQSLYGDTSLFYTIMIFNDIYHDAELTRDRLENHGINVLNELGLNALNDIYVFKTKYEYNEEDPFPLSDF